MPRQHSVSPTHDPGTTSFPVLDDPPEGLSIDPIASQWRRLSLMDQGSLYFLPLLSSLIAGAGRLSTIELQGEDATITLDALDKAFRDGKIPDDHGRDIRDVMRRLAHNSGQVPSRYQVKPGTIIVEDNVIASGAFSEIRRGRLGGRTVAVRTLRTGLKDAQKRFCKECIIWMSVSHPRVLQLIAVDIDPRSGQCSMISELMKGNIKDYISKNSADRLRLLSEAAMGLQYLHKCGIVHGDLKGRNILVTDETPPRACLADFGLSTLIPSDQGGQSTNTAGGTLLYMAPELLAPARFGRSDSRPTQPADIYAFGMVIYEVLTGFDPFYDLSLGTYEIVLRVSAGERPTKPINAEGIGFGSGTWELVQECWKRQSKRPKIDRVLQHLKHVSKPSTLVAPAEALRSDPQIILQRWRALASHDPRSIDIQLLDELVDSKGNRNITLTFRGKDATTVMNTIDGILKENKLPDRTRLQAFEVLHTLAGVLRQVPKSYLVGMLAEYKVEKRVLAGGGFTDVRRGKLKGIVVAVKTIRVSLEDGEDFGCIHEAFCKECVLWMNISHPNLLRLLAVKINPKSGNFSMISEMMTNGNIVNYIRVNRANRIQLLRDVAKGLEYLHNSGIIHGDLKGRNILINNEAPPRACISDFGLSAIAPSVSSNPDTDECVGGTFGYMAPELLLGNPRLSQETDIYAFGMVVYEVVAGVHPFGRRRLAEIPGLTIEGLRPAKPEDLVATGFGSGTWEFTEQCWDKDHEKRPSTREAVEHFESVAKVSTAVDPGPVPGALVGW